MMYANRNEAGKQLAHALQAYNNNPNAVICALPRGGVVVGHEVAKALNLPLDIIVTRKIGAPFNDELAVGAVTEEGDVVLLKNLINEFSITKEYIANVVAKKLKEIERRLSLYRGNKPPLDLTDKIAILVDDGIATGATMEAAIQSAQRKGAQKIIVAVSIAEKTSLTPLQKKADGIVCLATPAYFPGVGSYYLYFPQVEDEEVISSLSSGKI